MERENIFSPDKVTAANITVLSQRQSVLEEQRICEISEIAFSAADRANEMINEGYGVYEILSILSDTFSEQNLTPHPHSLTENKEILSKYLSMLTARDKVIFTEILVDAFRRRGISLSETDFLPTRTAGESFTYVKNPLADEAYDVFSQDFSDPRLSYSSNISDAAGTVARGDAVYALLPLEERGARLASVAELLFKEDLKINSVTPVFGFEGNADMKYALVSRHYTVPTIAPDDDRYLELRLRADSSSRLADIFSAAEVFGAFVYRVNTATFDTEDGPCQFYSVVFRDEGRDFTELLTYLTLFFGAFTPIGLYKNLE